MSATILVAEDEAKIAALLADYLTAAGMRATVVGDGDEVMPAIAAQRPDLVLLDIMLPNRDGLSLCREIRAAGALPVILLTARVEEIDRLLGLELGADDYICKPFSPREVVARVKAVLRRASGAAPAATRVVDIRIDEPRMEATVNGQRLNLTPVEFRLLAVLARHPGRVYRRDELLDLIYDDYRDVSDRTVDSHVKNLRRKLGTAVPGFSALRSVYGIGYKLDED
ncbi:MAG: response regulator [Gammaproteobacteria bacterium]